MAYYETGLLADPNFRRERARKAATSRTTIAHHVAAIVERADELTAEQRAALTRAVRLAHEQE